MQFKSIKTVFIIPILLLITVIFVFQSVYSLYQYKNSIDKEIKYELWLQAKMELNIIENRILKIAELAKSSAANIGALKKIDDGAIFTILQENIRLDPLIFGSGAWFEPNEYQPNVKYYGPYFYKDKAGKLNLTWEYSNENYDYFKWNWYKSGFNPNTSVSWTEPYFDSVSKVSMITATAPIKRNNKVIGVVTIDLSIDDFQNYVSNLHVGKRGFAFILTQKGLFLGLKNDNEKIIDPQNPKIQKLKKKIIHSTKIGIVRENWGNKDVFIAYSPIGEAGLKMVLVLPATEVYQGFNITITTIIMVFLLLVAMILIMFTTIFSNKIAKPITSIIDKMKKVEVGNFDIEPAIVKIKDEIGELSYSFNSMTEKLLDLIQREKFLREIILASVTSLDIKDVLKTIVSKTGEMFKADRCFFMQYDSINDEYMPIEEYEYYASSSDIKSLVGLKHTREQMKVFKHCFFELKQVYAIDDINTIKWPKENWQIFKTNEDKSFIAVPMYYMDNLLGILICTYIQNYKQFEQNDIDLLSAIASQSAIILNQSKLFQDINEAKNKEILLRMINNEILTSDNIDSAIKNMLNEIGKLIDVDRIVMRFYNPVQREFSSVVGEYRKSNDIPSMLNMNPYPKEIDDYIAQRTIDKNEIFIIENSESTEYPEFLREALKKLKIISAVIVPVIYKDTHIGIIILACLKTKKCWNDKELELVKSTIQQLSIGIHLFNITNNLAKSLEREQSLREFIFETRKLKESEQIFHYLLKRLTNMFNVKRAVYLHQDQDNNFMVRYESIKNNDISSLLNQVILTKDHNQELSSIQSGEIVVINDVKTEINNQSFKKHLENHKIKAFLKYPTIKIIVEEGEDPFLSSLMICSETQRNWTQAEVQSFKLIIDTAHIIYLEALNRNMADQTKKTFLATLTHDLKSPIIAEQRALEFIMSQKPETTLSDFSEYLDDIYKTNEELLRIVGNILAIYHYETGKIDLKLSNCHIDDIISDSVRAMRHFAKDQESKIIINIQENLPQVIADRDEINRVTTNLLNNALKHNKKGTNIVIFAQKIDNKVQVAVSDNGKGINESESSQIFQKYPVRKSDVGSGLGLYLSKQIIEAHNEKIWFDTEVGKGTTFYFTLKIA